MPPNETRLKAAIAAVCLNFAAAAMFMAAIFAVPVFKAGAAYLNLVSDVISTSAPAAPADHAVSFRLATALPASGKIIITPQAEKFVLPGSLSALDTDVLIDGIEQTVAAYPDAEVDFQVSVTSGSSGNITLTSNKGIEALASMTVKIGRNAEFGGRGDARIVNPETAGSYKVFVRTENGSGSVLDQANTMIAVVEPVRMGTANNEPPLYCGDGACNNGETCALCRQDCGVCPAAPVGGGGLPAYAGVPGQTIYYSHGDGSSFTLRLPDGYWDSPAIFTVTPSYGEVIKYLGMAPGNFPLVGDHGYYVTAIDSKGNPLTRLNKVFEVTLAYTAQQASLFDEGSIGLYVWKGGGSGWVSADGVVPDKNGRTVSGFARDLGVYALFGRLKPGKSEVPAAPATSTVPITPSRPDGEPAVPPGQPGVPDGQKDTAAPEAFVPIITRSPYLFQGRYFAAFGTRDAGSGIDRYEVAEQPLVGFGDPDADLNGLSWKKSASPYVLKHQRGLVRVFVRAVDRAGNSTVGTAQASLGFVYPWRDRTVLGVLVILLLAAVRWAVIRNRSEHAHNLTQP